MTDPIYEYVQELAAAKEAKKKASAFRDDIIARLKTNNPSEIVLPDDKKLVYTQSKSKPGWNEKLLVTLLLKCEPTKFTSEDEARVTAKKMLAAHEQMTEFKDSCAIKSTKTKKTKVDGETRGKKRRRVNPEEEGQRDDDMGGTVNADTSGTKAEETN
jgi:hypothetical protein